MDSKFDQTSPALSVTCLFALWAQAEAQGSQLGLVDAHDGRSRWRQPLSHVALRSVLGGRSRGVRTGVAAPGLFTTRLRASIGPSGAHGLVCHPQWSEVCMSRPLACQKMRMAEGTPCVNATPDLSTVHEGQVRIERSCRRAFCRALVGSCAI